MFTTLIVIHVLAAVVLTFTVLLQTGRGAELGAAFGSLGQATFSRGRTPFIAKFTTGLAVVFMLTSLSLAFLSQITPQQSLVTPGATALPGSLEAAPPPVEQAPAQPTGDGSVLEQTAAPAQEQEKAPAKAPAQPAKAPAAAPAAK